MNRAGNIIIISVIAVLLAGGAFFLWQTREKSAETGLQKVQVQVQNQNQKQNLPEGDLIKGTYYDLQNQVQSLKCTALMAGARPQSVYYDRGRLRADIIVETAQGPYNMHLILRDGWQYTWYENGSNAALKLKEAPAQPDGSYQTIIPHYQLDFYCSPWTADESMFELPPEFIFKDITAPEQK